MPIGCSGCLRDMAEMTFHLSAFDGPLDLLLHLIAKNKVSIYDIPIAEICEQYIEVLEDARRMDMDVAGDFIAMAAQLIYIKSKMLLPVYDEEEEEDPRQQLVEMLLEYQRIKQMTPYFRQQTDVGRNIYVKPPELLDKSARVEYRHPVEDLLKAARSILEKAQQRVPPSAKAFKGIVGREPVPVDGKITMILRRFLGTARLRFRQLFEGAKSRSEIVATFLAVLELSKTRRLMMEGVGEDIELYLTDEPEKLLYDAENQQASREGTAAPPSPREAQGGSNGEAAGRDSVEAERTIIEKTNEQGHDQPNKGDVE